MFSRKGKIYTTCIAAALIVSCVTVIPKRVQAAESERIYGENRYKTSVAVSKQGWEKADYAVIASGESYADALCSVPLAKICDGPVLLTGSRDLPEEVKEELKRLNVKKVFIAGGTGAVSSETENTIKDINSISVERLSGKDRYATSVAIAKKVKEMGGGKNEGVFFVSGEGFADALSGAPIAAAKGMPIILTQKNELPDVVRDYLGLQKISESYVIGGEGAINDSVKRIIDSQLNITSKRLAGKDRYETNIEVIKEFKGSMKYEKVFVAVGGGTKGDEFADALSGAVLAAKYNSPMIITYKSLAGEAENYLKSVIKADTKVVAIGGEAAVPSGIIEKIKETIDLKKEQQKKQDENKEDNNKSKKPGSKPSKPNTPDSKPLAKVYGTNPRIEMTGSKALIVCAGENGNSVKLTVYDREGQLKYVGQEHIVSGKCEIRTEFEYGEYTAKFRIGLGEVISVNFKAD